MSTFHHHLCVIALGAALAAPALAQSPTGSTTPSTQRTLPDGVQLSLDFVGNVAGNPVGGIAHGAEASYWVMTQGRFDLDKLWGWKGTELDTQAAYFNGDNLAREKIGNSISPQQTWRPVGGARLTRLTLSKKFDNGLTLTAGRAPVNSYFNNSPLNCVFMSNVMCLTTYGPIADIGITAFPNSSWAGLVRWDVDDRWYMQAGAFDYNNTLNLADKHGLDFSWNEGTGTVVSGEVGYETSLAKDRYARRYKLGFYRNDDGGRSPYFDADGNSAALTGKPTVALDGARMGWYVMGDQTVQRGQGTRNLTVFGRYFVNTGNVASIKWHAATGFVKTGTFEGRDRDTFSAFISNTHFDDEQIAYLRDRRAKAGGTGAPSADEIVGEINYGWQVRPGLRVLPNIQYVINPDPIYAPTRITDIPDALIVGLRVDVQVAHLMGW
ncbi:porin [Xanthomonas campestris]|uniref:Uncharacterized protein n=1 Tax=Xanthomonas arboricola TaxID=56448 RepID=A0A2S7ADW2_9XANT|nr:MULTISPECIES: carbohydrate porin [Xanthomonas]MBB5737732.1 porin [Xanthomonas sp. CFBP 8152]NIJ78634.1 porin [Xanthomonas sp. CFBP 8151]PPT78035.1 hypothetical protein XarbCFBP8152_12550 [Xanthomonas arboricola]PPU07896.1 hypothetical protein XarjCFBP7645_09930 [Xanthomonas arboricola]